MCCVVQMRGHGMHSSSEDDDADFRDVPFPQDSAMQQVSWDINMGYVTYVYICVCMCLMKLACVITH